jgi:hypothetical protein
MVEITKEYFVDELARLRQTTLTLGMGQVQQ